MSILGTGQMSPTEEELAKPGARQPRAEFVDFLAPIVVSQPARREMPEHFLRREFLYLRLHEYSICN